MNSVFFVFCGTYNFSIFCMFSQSPTALRPSPLCAAACFRLLDANQRRVAQLVDARLNRQHRRQRHVDKLEVSRFEFALHPDAGFSLFDLHDDGGVRPAQQLRQDHARLRVSIIVGLQSGKDQIELLVFDRRREGLRGVEGIQSDEVVVLEMNRAVRALGQRFAQHLLRPRRAGGDDHNLAFMLFPLAQRFFQRVRVRLVDLVRNVLADPGAASFNFSGASFCGTCFMQPKFSRDDSLLPWQPRKRVSINELEGGRKYGKLKVMQFVERSSRVRTGLLFCEYDGLPGNIETLTAPHVLAGHHVVFANHVRPGLREPGAVAFVCPSGKLLFLVRTIQVIRIPPTDGNGDSSVWPASFGRSSKKSRSSIQSATVLRQIAIIA